MAKFEDYIPGGDNDPNAPAGGIDKEIEAAEADQQKRKDDATPVDWEERYKNLEVLNSQQSQTLGEYRGIIDGHILNPTPASEPAPEESTPITYDDLLDKPDEVIAGKISAMVESHPAIQEAREIKQENEAIKRDGAVKEFQGRHPDYEDIKATPEFASWVYENNTRVALAQAADGWDMNSADALFSLYKAEKGIAQMTEQAKEATAIQAASLEDSSAVMVADEPRFSRSEFISKKTRAEQGDREADEWIKRNVGAYREALGNGNVRD